MHRYLNYKKVGGGGLFHLKLSPAIVGRNSTLRFPDFHSLLSSFREIEDHPSSFDDTEAGFKKQSGRQSNI